MRLLLCGCCCVFTTHGLQAVPCAACGAVLAAVRCLAFCCYAAPAMLAYLPLIEVELILLKQARLERCRHWPVERLIGRVLEQ